MPTFTTTDVIFEEYTVQRVDEAGTIRVLATVQYRITTQEGRQFTGSRTVELTGTAKTRAGALLQDIKDLVKAQEGIS